jgi:uncharacterized protein (DUF302 family)
MTTTTDDAIRYVVPSSKSVDRAQQDLTAAAQKRRFGVLHSYDLKQTLAGKGFQLEPEVRVLEICSPAHADKVLKAEVAMNMALPCRISVWQEGGTTRIGMIRPKAMLEMLTEQPVLRQVVDEVERLMVEMIDEAR